MPNPKPDSTKSTGQVDDNQDDLGRDASDRKHTDPRRHPQVNRDKTASRESVSGDALHDGSQH